MNYNNNLPKDKYCYNESSYLNTFRKRLFTCLIKIPDSPGNKEHNLLVEILVHKKTICKSLSSFNNHLSDIYVGVKNELIKLNYKELDNIITIVTKRIFRYFLQDESYFNYQYFIEEIKNQDLLKWSVI